MACIKVSAKILKEIHFLDSNLALEKFHSSSISRELVIAQEEEKRGGEESRDNGELMRSCSRDKGTKVQVFPSLHP